MLPSVSVYLLNKSKVCEEQDKRVFFLCQAGGAVPLAVVGGFCNAHLVAEGPEPPEVRLRGRSVVPDLLHDVCHSRCQL